ncbi:MAG: DegV family protein [Sporichthyaceae bacterium]|nr:DegV family protein [Sporichthyaceae bacterium]
MTVAVLTDTAAALTAELAADWGVQLVPLTVSVGGRAFRDTEVDLSGVLIGTPDATGANSRITTAGPPPGEFLAALDRAGPGTAAAVIVTVASRLSGTHAAARIAAALAPVPVKVVDSGSAAGGQALVALAAAERARSGAGLDEAAAAARTATTQVRLVGCLESLDGLVRSGRVPGLAAAAVRWVALQFVFELRAGSIRPLRPVGGFPVAAERMLARCIADSRGGSGTDVVALGPAGSLRVTELTERVAQAAPPASSSCAGSG